MSNNKSAHTISRFFNNNSNNISRLSELICDARVQCCRWSNGTASSSVCFESEMRFPCISLLKSFGCGGGGGARLSDELFPSGLSAGVSACSGSGLGQLAGSYRWWFECSAVGEGWRGLRDGFESSSYATTVIATQTRVRINFNRVSRHLCSFQLPFSSIISIFHAAAFYGGKINGRNERRASAQPQKHYVVDERRRSVRNINFNIDNYFMDVRDAGANALTTSLQIND